MRRCLQRARAHADLRPALCRVDRVQHDQAGIVDRAVGILEGCGEGVGLQRLPRRICREIEHARARQPLPAAQVVVHEQPDAQHPRRPQPLLVGQHEAHRSHDVRRYFPQHLALDERLTHQPEIEVLEVTQTTVDELGRARGGTGGEIAHLAQEYRKAAAGGIACQPAAIYSATNDCQVVDVLH